MLLLKVILDFHFAFVHFGTLSLTINVHLSFRSVHLLSNGYVNDDVIIACLFLNDIIIATKLPASL